MSFTQEWYDEKMRAYRDSIQSATGIIPMELFQAAKLKHKSPRNGGYRSKTEASYAQYLDLELKARMIDCYMYEPMSLKLGDDCRYVPDFLVVTGPTIELVEIKGRKGASYYSKPLSKTKIRVAATRFPWFQFKLVWPGGRAGEWDTELVKGDVTR